MKKQLLVAMIASILSISAHASPFQIDTGVDWAFDSDSDSVTEEIAQLGLTGSLATSVYYNATFDADGNLLSADIFDSNVVSLLASFGYSAGSYTAIDGSTPVSFHDPAAPGEVNIDNLNLVNGAGTDTEGFDNTPLDPLAFQQWGLELEYAISGSIDTTSGINLGFDSGYYNIFYTDYTGARIQVLRLELENSTLQLANLDLMGFITYDFNGNGINDEILTDFQKNFFIDAATGSTYYDLWNNGVSINPVAVSWALDTNIENPIPTKNQLVAFTYDTDKTALIRQTNLDSSIIFDVPEPATLALMGVGFLGMGATARRRKA